MPDILPRFNRICIFSTAFLNVRNVKLQGNASSVSRSDSFGQTNGQTDGLT